MKYTINLNTQAHNNVLILTLALLLSTIVSAQSWEKIGPGPLHFGQNEGISNRPVIGAIHGIASHPTNSDIIYIAAVNGGIWKTINATSSIPTWLPQTDFKSSLSMGDVEFDITDNTYQTLIAGSGRFSSLGRTGGERAGVFRTIDGGTTWQDLNTGMDGRNIASVEARGSVLMAAVDIADSFTCGNIGIYRSTDTGANWSQLSTAQGIPSGAASALVADPNNPNIFYAGINTFNGTCSTLNSGIYKTIDTGASWVKVNDPAIETVIGTRSCHYEVAVGHNVGTNPEETGNVFASMVCSGGRLSAIFRSGDAGTTWVAMGLPETIDNEGIVGLHPGGQGNLHSSIAADPTDDNIVYIGGDRQPFGFPNSIGANDYSGRLFRGDATQAKDSQWVPLTHIGTASNSSPHADSRDLQFDSNGILLESSDGGIYKRTSPQTTAGDWFSLNGDLQITEQHDAIYDSNSSVVISGNQDNGTSVQSIFASTTWENYFNADGGDVEVDDISMAASNLSTRFYSFQNLGAFRRIVYNDSNNIVSQTGPDLIVVNGGQEFIPQFVTPLAVNTVSGNRLIFGGRNAVYESVDQGDTISEIGSGIVVLSSGRNNIAYGAVDNADILYVGACQNDCFDSADGEDGIFVRTTDVGALTHVFASNSSTIQGVTINPNDSTQAFIIDNTRVFYTSDTGATWPEITGNLSNFGRLRSIELLPDASNNRLVVGSDKGVYIAEQSDGYTNWSTAAPGIPNTPVFELDFDSGSGRLVAGTMGRGSFVLTFPVGNNLAPVLGSDFISVSKGGVANTLVSGANSLIENDSDPDEGDILTMETIAVVEPMNGIVTLNTDGTFSYQHDDSFTNSDQFFYRVCDNANPSLCTDGEVDISVDLGEGYCSAPNITIPDGDGMSAIDTLSVMATGEISDLDVLLEVNHTWVGDLTVSLKHVSTGTEVILIDRPGFPAPNIFGCSENDISAELDDEGLAVVEDECTTPIAIKGLFTPNNLLSGFDTLELSGNWELTVTDAVNVESGALISWCLSPTVINGTVPPVLAGIGNKNVNELSELSFTVTATDEDTAQNDLTFSLSGEPEGASITSSGDFSFTPTEAQGPGEYSFNVIVSDDGAPALTDSEEITVTVFEANQNPVLAAIGNHVMEELDTLIFTATATDADTPAQILTFSLSGAPTGAVISSNGEFSFTPTEAQGPGLYNFDVIVTDNGPENLTARENISIEVTEDDIIFENGFDGL